MTSSLRAVCASVLAGLLGLGEAAAGPAVVHRETIVRELPADESKHLFDLIAGMHIEVIGCNTGRWCKIESAGRIGWIHEVEIGLAPGREGAAASIPATGSSQTGSLSTAGEGGLPAPGSPEGAALCCAAAIDSP